MELEDNIWIKSTFKSSGKLISHKTEQEKNIKVEYDKLKQNQAQKCTHTVKNTSGKKNML